MKLADARLVIGIPTVSRPRNYLLRTLDSVIAGVPERARDRVEILVLNAELPAEKHEVFAQLSARYRALVDSGFLTLMSGLGAHPELAEDRVAGRARREQLGPAYWDWEVKLILDAARLMEICRPRGDYYLHLEDDIIAADDFYDRFMEWFDRRFADRSDWAALCLTPLVAMRDGDALPPGLLRTTASLFYRCADLPGVIEYLRALHGELPMDAALAQRLSERGETMYARVPALIQHVGRFSTRAGVFRTHESPSFPERGVTRAARQLREFSDVFAVTPRFIWRLLRMRDVLPPGAWERLNRVRDALTRRGR